MSRLAQDLRNLLDHIGEEPVDIVAHSLGAAVTYNYIDLFGTDAIKRLVVVDEPAVLMIDPAWSEADCTRFGAIYAADEVHQMTGGFLAGDAGDLLDNVVDAMTTPDVTTVQRELIRSCMQISGEAAAQLYLNNICQDYRDVLAKIDMLRLCVTRRGSLHPWQSHQWMHEQVPSSGLFVFEEDEGGNHFPFVESARQFNEIVTEF